MIALSTSLHSGLRPLALTALLLAELLLVSFGFDAYSVGLSESGQWFGILAYAGQLAKVLVAVVVFALLGIWPRLPRYLDDLNRSLAEDRSVQYLLVAHLVAFAALLWCTAVIFGEPARVAGMSGLLPAAWMVAFAATTACWLLALAPWRFWMRLFAAETTILMAAAAVGMAAWMLAVYAQSLWSPMSEMTFRLSSMLLGLLYADIHVVPESMELGALEFVVRIAPVCSGYEGMGLMAIFTAFYLSIFRNDFRFPQALLLFPIGLVVIWLFNLLRIVALIAIGASFSPDVAVGGFHSQAGWISFIAVIILTLALAYRVPFFSRITAPSGTAGQGMTLPMALLIPFIALLAATILSSAISADFDWFYPLRVIAVGFALAFCWRHLGLSRPVFRFEPWFAGFAVFAVWILLVPSDRVVDTTFSSLLFNAPPAIAGAWLLLRIVGSVITVPIAEELLFRGYLLGRLARVEPVVEGRLAFSWFAYLLSSLLFGLLHADWIAGIAAGLVFGWVRYRSDSIRDAIVAHASANAFLTGYIVVTGHWSLW